MMLNFIPPQMKIYFASFIAGIMTIFGVLYKLRGNKIESLKDSVRQKENSLKVKEEVIERNEKVSNIESQLVQTVMHGEIKKGKVEAEVDERIKQSNFEKVSTML